VERKQTGRIEELEGRNEELEVTARAGTFQAIKLQTIADPSR